MNLPNQYRVPDLAALTDGKRQILHTPRHLAGKMKGLDWARTTINSGSLVVCIYLINEAIISVLSALSTPIPDLDH